MKRILFFLSALYINSCLQAQVVTPFRSETDAVEAFNRIEYWHSHQQINDSVNTIDSLYRANEIFVNKFIGWLSQDTRTATLPFTQMKAAGVTIAQSKDKKVRVYSWDTWTGGTMHFYEAVIQYKTASGYKAILLADPIDAEEGTPGNWFSKVDILKTAAGKTIYLLTGNGVFATREIGRNMMGVSIKGSQLEQNIQLFKTELGLTDELYVGFTIQDPEKDYKATIEFNEKTKQLLVPEVSDAWLLTGKKEIYTFNGKYFVRKK